MKSIVKIIYTGGTFGMQPSAQGLMPSSDLHARLLQAIHDSPQYKRQADDLTWDWDEKIPLLDSAQMTPCHWESLAKDCANAQEFSAIIIIHGTDTLSYTASALAFLLANSSSSIIITGAQIPLGAPDSDALDNFMGALRATKEVESGVWVYFNHDLLPAARTVKRDAIGLKGFATPRLMNHDSFVPKFALSMQKNQRPWKESCVSVIHMTPGIHNDQIDMMLSHKPQAIILSLYGLGTLNSADKHLMQGIKAATNHDIIVVAVSQCYVGCVEFDTYEAGSQLQGLGVLSAREMTLEAAYCKLMILFRLGYTTNEIRALFVRSIVGEISE